MADLTEAQLRAAAAMAEQKEAVENLVKASVGMLVERFKTAEQDVRNASLWAGHPPNSIPNAVMVMAWQKTCERIGKLQMDRARTNEAIPSELVAIIDRVIDEGIKAQTKPERPAILRAAR